MDFYDVIVLHCNSYIGCRVSRVTQIMSHELVISISYESRVSEERLYKEVKGPGTRAFHATILVLSLPMLDENKTLYPP